MALETGKADEVSDFSAMFEDWDDDEDEQTVPDKTNLGLIDNSGLVILNTLSNRKQEIITKRYLPLLLYKCHVILLKRFQFCKLR